MDLFTLTPRGCFHPLHGGELIPMATQSSFKQQCPSCDHPVTIKDADLVGKKIDCPKCKYRFVVEEPGDASAPKKKVDKSSAIKNGAAGAKTKPMPAGKKAAYSYDCELCNRVSPLADADLKLLSREDRDLLAQEGMDPKGMVKVICPKCGESALINKAKHLRKAADKASTRDDDDDTERQDEKKGSKKLVLGLALAGVAVVLLAVAAIFMFSGDKKPTAVVSNTGPAAAPASTDKKPEGDAAKDNVDVADITNLLPPDSELVANLPV